MTPADTTYREPKQARSRESFEKTIEAALSLIQECGNDEFTLADVSSRSGVSIGSIYARFEGKELLLRVAHARKMDDIDAVSAYLFAPLPLRPAEVLRDVVREAIDQVITVLVRYADTLRPFMLRATHDPAISRRGAASHEALARHFSHVLEAWQSTALDPSGIDWCFNVVYSVVARRLGLGSTMEGSGDMPWDDIASNLSKMVASYLQSGPLTGPDHQKP